MLINKDVREYYKRLVNEANDFIVPFTKRYSRYPYKEFLKVSRLKFNNTDTIKIGGVDFTLKEAIKEVKAVYPSLKSKLQLKYFNKVLKGFIKDCNGIDKSSYNKIYRDYQDMIHVEFKNIEESFIFCVNALNEVNKYMKEAKRKEHTKMDTNVISETIEDIELYQSLLMEACESDDIDLIEEGVNSDAAKIFRSVFKEVHSNIKKAKKFTKECKFNDAKLALKANLKLLSNAEKNLDDLDETLVGTLIGLILGAIINCLKAVLMVIPPVGMASVVIHSIEEAKVLLNKFKSKKEFDTNDFNAFLVHVKGNIALMKDATNDAINYVNSKEKKAKEDAKNLKSIKESAEYNDAILALYEACNKGEITLEKREESIRLIGEAILIQETANDVDLTKKEKFDKVRTVLYERCADGLISEDDRENMISEAYNQIYGSNEVVVESDDASGDMTKSLDNAANDATKDLEKNVKDLDKKASEDIEKAANEMSDK